MPEKYVLQGGGRRKKGRGSGIGFGVWVCRVREGGGWFGTSLVLNFCEVLKRNASWARFIVS